MKKVIQGVIGIAANALSAPAQYRAYKAEKQATRDVNTIRRARSYDNSTSDDAVRARTAADMVKHRIQGK